MQSYTLATSSSLDEVIFAGYALRRTMLPPTVSDNHCKPFVLSGLPLHVEHVTLQFEVKKDGSIIDMTIDSIIYIIISLRTSTSIVK